MSKVYCSWVEAEVDDSLLMTGCHPKDGVCNVCKRSQQLDYGVDAETILKRMKDE